MNHLVICPLTLPSVSFLVKLLDVTFIRVCWHSLNLLVTGLSLAHFGAGSQSLPLDKFV